MSVYNTRWTWDFRINQWNELFNDLSIAIDAAQPE
jgi:hypothetical protein